MKDGLITDVRASVCPCCGAPVMAAPLDDLIRALPPVQGSVLRAVAAGQGEYVGSDEIARQVWPPDGEPEHIVQVVSQAARRVNQRIAGKGWRIESRFGVSGGYRIVREAEK